MRGKICDAAQQRILIADGAWGTFLIQKGLRPGQCPELWCIDRPDDVLDVARSYVGAGADLIETNTFGGSRLKLDRYGLGHRTAEINEAAARISRQAAGQDHWVIGSIGPTGVMLLMEEATPEELYDVFREQVQALERGGADAVCIETMIDIEEAVIAIEAAKQNTSLEVICTFTFDRTLSGEYRTMMGQDPVTALRRSLQAGADIVGSNCGNGLSQMVEITVIMRAENSTVPILIQANAGVPRNIDGLDVFPETPEEMAATAKEVVKAGANILGGCCGTTPAHIVALRNTLLDIS